MSRVLPDGMAIRWWGHATFAVTGPAGTKFLIDPYFASNPAFPQEHEAEVRKPGAFGTLLLTHAHFDHFEDALPLLQGDPALQVVCQFDVAEWLKARGAKAGQLIGMNTGGTVPVGDVRVTMVPAVHTSSVGENGEPRALGVAVGYVLRFPNGFTIYDTGDTAVTMDMQIVRDLYRPDLVILPIGDFYTMGPEQAAYALKLLQPRFALGAHYGTFNGMPPGRPEQLEREIARYSLPTRILQLKPGEALA